MQIKQLFLTSIVAMAVLSPAVADADIAAGAGTADCDSEVLKTTSGSANLEANWDPNTINLNWYADADSNTPLTVQTAAQTCTYDGVITLPDVQPTKPGYTFDHWQVRQSFNLSTLDTSINSGNYYARGWLNNADICAAYGSGTVSNDFNARVCVADSAALSDVALYQWKNEFSYGTVRGEAYCSAKKGNLHDWTWGGNKADWTATESELTSASGMAGYCWCKATGFDAEKDGSFVDVVSPVWVYNDDGNPYNCEEACAYSCSNRVHSYPGLRAALYGVTR